MILTLYILLSIEKMSVRCNQTNKKFKVDVTVLSSANGEPLNSNHLKESSQLLMDYNRKSWPVTVIKVYDELNTSGQ